MRHATLALATLTLLANGCVEYGLSRLDRQDVFTQLPATEVDILLVVDNSCSMQPYQNELAANFENFLTFFEEGDVDYHIGVTTTSVVDVHYSPLYNCSPAAIAAVPPPGELVGGTYITPDTDDGDELFADLVNVGVCGAGTEMGLEAAAQAMGGALQGDFLRDDAFLSFIFVSDEQDGSPYGVNDYSNAFRSIKDERGMFNASALVVTDIDDCNQQQRNSGATPGTRYVEVAEDNGGILGSICDDSFERVVTELSLASSRLVDRFYLSETPDVSSIVVFVDDEEVPCDDGDWTYEQVEYDGVDDYPAIVFDRAAMPPPYTEIVVQYNKGPGGEFTCGGGDDE
jgi:hypothetical protein